MKQDQIEEQILLLMDKELKSAFRAMKVIEFDYNIGKRKFLYKGEYFELIIKKL